MSRKVLVVITLWLFCLIWSLHLPFSESEIWGLFLSEKMFSGGEFFHPSFIYKGSFHAFVGAWGQLFHSSEKFYLAARVLFSVFIPLIAMMTFWTKDKRQLLEIALVAVFAAPFIFLYGSVVRADMLAAVLAFAILGILGGQSRYSFWLLSTLNVLLLLTTPKSIFFILALSAAALAEKKGRQYFSTLILPAVVLVGVMTFMAMNEQILLAYSSAWNFFLGSYDEGLGRPGYFSSESFLYIFKFLVSSPFWIALWIVGIWRSFKESTPKMRGLAVFGLVSLFALFLHNDRLPFFISAFALSGLLVVYQGWQVIKGRWRWYLLGIAALWSAFIYLNAWRNFGNGEQLKALQAGEEMLRKTENARVFDGTGLFAKFPGEIPYFLGPSQPEQKKKMLETLLDFDPQFIFYTSKMLYGEPELSEYMSGHQYAHLGGGVYCRGSKISLIEDIPDGEWTLHAGQEYYAVDYQKWIELLQSKGQVSAASSSFASPKEGGLYVYPSSVEEGGTVWERQLLFRDNKGTFRSYADYLNSPQTVFTAISQVYVPRAYTLNLILTTEAPWKGSERPFSDLFAFPRDLVPWN